MKFPARWETAERPDPPGTPGASGSIDPLRVVVLRGGAPRRGGRYVLYWCQVQKRSEWSPALVYATAQADALGVPLLVYEGLRHDYPHASWRHHRFILDGVREMGRRLAARGVAHYFYLERDAAARRPLVRELAAEACLVVTDDCPTFLAPRQAARAASQLDCPLHAIDGAGVAPMRAFPARETAAFTLRPKIMRLVPGLLEGEDPSWPPRRGSLDLGLPAGLSSVLARAAELPGEPEELDRLALGCDIDRSVRPAAGARGGRAAGLGRLRRFLSRDLGRYAEGRSRAAEDVTSHLSPYLHYGMLSAVEIARAARDESPAGLADPDVAAFVEELVVRRELALNFCLHTPEHRSLGALPSWARENLERHRHDRRPRVYDLEALEAARTHDPLWNAVQEELRETGQPHGYLRMLWGKKIIEWAPSYEQALEWMIHLNDKYAYDGRDASSYANILWCFGLHDRPFPRRPVFGAMRPMTSESTGRKAGAAAYIARVRGRGRLSTPTADCEAAGRAQRLASQGSGSSGMSLSASSKKTRG